MSIFTKKYYLSLVGLFILSIGCAEGMKDRVQVEELRGELHETCSIGGSGFSLIDKFNIEILKKLMSENKKLVFRALGAGRRKHWVNISNYRYLPTGPLFNKICHEKFNFKYNVGEVLSTLLINIKNIDGGEEELEFLLSYCHPAGRNPILMAFEAVYRDSQYATGGFRAMRAILRDGGKAGKESLVEKNISYSEVRRNWYPPANNAFSILEEENLSALDIIITGLMLGGGYNKIVDSYALDGISENLLKLLVQYARPETVNSIKKIKSKIDETKPVNRWTEDISNGSERRKKFDRMVEKVLGKI